MKAFVALNMYPHTSKEIQSENLSYFEDVFEGYSREWIKKTWNVCSYLGVDFCFEDLSSKVEKIMEKITYLKDFGSFWMKEGFFDTFIKMKDFEVIYNPKSETIIREGVTQSNSVVILDTNSKIFNVIKEKNIPRENQDKDIFLFHCTYSDTPNIALFVITKTLMQAQELLDFLNESKELLNSHEIQKGWPVCTSGRYMVTPLPRHPAKILSDALRLNCKWAFFVGPDEDLAVKELTAKLEEIDLEFAVFSGQLTGDQKAFMVDWNEYPDPQSSSVSDACDLKISKGGLLFAIFNNILDSDMDILKDKIDGYAYHEGNSDFIEVMDAPFLVMPHHVDWGEVPPSQWLFVEKVHANLSLKERVKKAILSKKAIGIFEDGKIVGPSKLVNLVKILLADKVYLRNLFGTYFFLNSKLDGTKLKISMENKLNEPLNGVLEIRTNSGIEMGTLKKINMSIESGEKKEIAIEMCIQDVLSGSYGLLLTEFSSNNRRWKDLCHIEVPPLISTFPIMFSDKPQLEVPLALWNNSDNETIDLGISVFSQGKRIFEDKRSIKTYPHKNCKTIIPVDLGNFGDYRLELSQSAYKTNCRLKIRNFDGKAFAFTGDFDGDGLEEAILENDFVISKVISIGGRLLQYRLKKIEADLFFKLFPKKPEDWRVSGRRRRFYPFGGLEEFIQQPTVEGHEKFMIQVVKKEGSSAVVSAEADMNKNVLKKTFTLFGGTPLLEVRYEADFINPELNVIGVNPLIKLGNSVDRSHVIYYPTKEGILEERYKSKLYGKRVTLSEDWIACYDEQEKLGLIMSYDANVPFLTHLWMNTPDNPDTHYYYIEIQPWIKVNTGTTTFFSYYLYGFDGGFDAALRSFKKLFSLD
jgi:hypothetical protein